MFDEVPPSSTSATPSGSAGGHGETAVAPAGSTSVQPSGKYCSVFTTLIRCIHMFFGKLDVLQSIVMNRKNSNCVFVKSNP